MTRLVLWCVLAAGCAHRRPAALRDASAEARVFYYHDDEGLQVTTTAVQVAQPLPHGDALAMTFVLDHVALPAVDAVSRASAQIGGEAGLNKDRTELNAAYSLDLSTPSTPMTLLADARVSIEPDYRSYSGGLHYSAELNRSNTYVGASLAYGYDTIDPKSYAPEDAGRWPASHQRVSGTFALRQLLSRRVDLSVGAGAGWQTGALESPYRRALVLGGGGVFASYHDVAERHPGERTRFTAFAGLAAYLGRGAALHLRLGGYADTWALLAIAPEIAGVFELGARVLLTLSYRYYIQSSADFYAPRYQTLEPVRSGDRRLGAVDEHLPGVELRAAVVGQAGRPGSFDLVASYQVSILRYWAIATTVLAHLPSLGLSFVY